MRFKTQLGIHPAYTQSINVPISLVNHYRELGLDNNLLAYVLQIMAAYWRGEEASHSQIAPLVGVSERSLRNYNAKLQELELATINGRYMHGNRLENDYDFTPLLDAAALLDHESEAKQASTKKNAYRMIEQIVTSMENGEDVSGLLLSLASEWRSETLTDYEPTGNQLPVETGNQLPVETGNQLPVETGNQLPVSRGNQLPVSKGNGLPPMTSSSQPEASFRLKPEAGFLSIDDDDQCINESNTNESSSMITDNPINKLLSLRGKKGQRFDRSAASVVFYKALQHFGEDEVTGVVFDWCDHAMSNAAITNAPGFVRVKLESGEWPPEPEKPATNESYYSSLPADLQGVIQR